MALQKLPLWDYTLALTRSYLLSEDQTMPWLLLSILFWSGCGQSDLIIEKKEVKISNPFFLQAAGGVMIYAVRVSDGTPVAETLFLSNDETEGSLTLAIGDYHFYALSYPQGTLSAAPSCAAASDGAPVSISGASQSVNLSFSSANCANEVFGGNSGIVIHSCAILALPTLVVDQCTPAGEFESYIVELTDYKLTDGSPVSKSDGIRSECLTAGTLGQKTAIPFFIPPGSLSTEDAPFTAQVFAYEQAGCFGAPVPFEFPSGIARGSTVSVTGATSVLFFDSNQVLHLYLGANTPPPL